MKLYTYWRSSAAYRVRIALSLKGVGAEHVPIHLVKSGGEQHSDDYRRINPGETVPSLVLDDGTVLTQSLAIISYLDMVHPNPSLFPGSPVERARVEAAAQLVACDIHPINNLRVGQYLKDVLGHDQDAVIDWMRHWMLQGLAAFQKLIDEDSNYCFGNEPTLADICLVPQLYNARRWGLDMAKFERLSSIEDRCLALDAFSKAAPENQQDAETLSPSA